MHRQAAKRTARHFGLHYDYEARTPLPGERLPGWLEPLRARAGELAGVRPGELVEILVQRRQHSIPPTPELRYSVTCRTLR